MTAIRIILTLALLCKVAEGACQPLSVQSDFNVTEWLRASWYVQKQQKNGYQKPSSLNCVVATYNETYRGTQPYVPGFRGQAFTVYNDCREGGKDGPVCNNFTSPDFKPSFAIPLCGRVTNKAEPAKLSVAPCLLPNFLAGNYWVAAAGPRPDDYQYAIVLAGQPTVERSDGCTTPDTCSNPAQFSCGLWFFTRQPIPEPSVMDTLSKTAREKGISTELLVTVDHADCRYDGYEIKANDRVSKEKQQIMV